MKTYELINPSDAIFFDAPDLETATVATAIVGQGKYAAKPEEGDGVPLFLFGGWEEFCNEKFGHIPDFKNVELMTKVAACLRSFRLVNERSSLNDICKYAKQYAERIESKQTRGNHVTN